MFVKHGTNQKQHKPINSVKTAWSNGAEILLTVESTNQHVSMLLAALVTRLSKESSWSELVFAVVDFAKVRFT
jgi:hypothetical protein